MPKAAIIANSDDNSILICCPACNCGHALNNRWKFNGDLEKPTFSSAYPGSAYSLLVTCEMHCDDPRHNYNKGMNRCHSYIKDGMIQFLGDSTHSLAGKTVPLDDI